MFEVRRNLNCILVLFVFFAWITHAQEGLDKFKPENINEKKWSSLKAIVQETKLLPTPDGIGGQGKFGSSVSIDGNRAIIGGPELAAHGAVIVIEFIGSNWVKTATILPPDGQREDDFGISVSLEGDTAVIGASSNAGMNGSRSGSVYVFKIDGSNNWLQTAKLEALDGASSDTFGNSVSLSGNRILVGATGDDDNGSSSGSAYIFELIGSTWSETEKITASDAGAIDQFGSSVSLEGLRAVISAPSTDDGQTNSGSVYVFEYDGTDWVEKQILKPNDVSHLKQFGHSLSLDNNRLLVGANGENFATGSAYIFDYDVVTTMWSQSFKITRDMPSTFDGFGGSVYLSGDNALIGNKDSAFYFSKSGANWIQIQKINASPTLNVSGFGFAVGMSGSTIIVGSNGDNINGIGVSGSTYIFDIVGANVNQIAKINVDEGAIRSNFGYSVSLSGNKALVGAYLDNEKSNRAGAIYFFEFDGTNWGLQEKLLAPDGANIDSFGYSVSLSGNKALIGSHRDIINGVQTGAAYVFEFDGSVWQQISKLIASDGAASDEFGFSVSLSGDKALIGAHRVENRKGSAYVFTNNGSSWVESEKLTSDVRESGDDFGHSVSILNNRALVGAPGDDHSSFGSAGSAYVFDFDGTSWSSPKQLIASDANSSALFGTAVSLSDNRVLIGASESTVGGLDIGSAYIFDWVQDTWSEKAILTPSASDEYSYYGSSVSLSGDVAIIGAFEDANLAGSAYVYQYNGVNWSEVSKLIASDASSDNQYGVSVSLFGDKALIGSNLDNDRGTESGSAYLVKLNLGFTISGSVTGITNGNTLILQNNLGDDLFVDENGLINFAIGVNNSTTYSVSVLSAIGQTCVVTGGGNLDGSGTVNNANITGIIVTCNTAPTVNEDYYDVGEDIVLNVLIADGVLNNDSDAEMDALTVVNPGTFNANGIGGEIVIAANGTFVYTPPMDAFGEALFSYQITDGVQQVDAELFIDVFEINDSPSFEILGDVDASPMVDSMTGNASIDNYIFNIQFGPNEDLDQDIENILVNKATDSNSILNSISISPDDNSLQMNLSFNIGVALIEVSIQDDGGVDDGGVDTSQVQEFIVSYTDIIFSDGYETPTALKLFNKYGLSVFSNTSSNEVSYSYDTDSLEFYNHTYHLNYDYNSSQQMEIVDYWLQEVESFERKGLMD